MISDNYGLRKNKSLVWSIEEAITPRKQEDKSSKWLKKNITRHPDVSAGWGWLKSSDTAYSPFRSEVVLALPSFRMYWNKPGVRKLGRFSSKFIEQVFSQWIELNNRVENLSGSVRFLESAARFLDLHGKECYKLNLVLQSCITEDSKYDDQM